MSTASPALAPDAAMVLGIASTALPFACTSEDAAERWLRILRLHGEAGATLQALGVSEGPLCDSSVEDEQTVEEEEAVEKAVVEEGEEETTATATTATAAGATAAWTSPSVGADGGDAFALVLERAAVCAGRRHAAGVATSDLLMAVMDVYGADFERVLRAHGTDRDEVLERLAAHAA